MGRESEGFYTLFLYVAITAIDYAFLSFVVVVSLPLLLFLFRKRLKQALIGSFIMEGLSSFDTLMFEEVVVESKEGAVKQKVLTPYARGMFEQITPVLVQEGMKSIQFDVPANLPLNAEGQLDFMAPVIQKLASGKKVKLDDFMPVIMSKLMPYIEGFASNLSKGVAPSTGETKNPFLGEVK